MINIKGNMQKKVSFLKNSIAIFFVVIFLTSCAYSVHMVHTSGFEPYAPIKQGKMIESEADQFVILYFASDNSYVDQAFQELLNKCKNGNITGITTKYMTKLGFFSWHNVVQMQGMCYKS